MENLGAPSRSENLSPNPDNALTYPPPFWHAFCTQPCHDRCRIHPSWREWSPGGELESSSFRAGGG
jgi:hypothetical protein